jgi:hypothetical protein
MATTDINQTTLTEYRLAMLEELGFSQEQALELVEAKKLLTTRNEETGRLYIYEVPIYWGDIKKMLDDGATYEQVLRILI